MAYKQKINPRTGKFNLVTNDGGSGSGYEPDQEDITLNSESKLQLKNRAATDSSMGYIILRKNKSFASQVTQANTIYEIRYAFDLGGATVTIPEGCTLKFEGGRLSNGTINGNNTFLVCRDNVCFSNLNISGSFITDQVCYKNFEGYSDDTQLLRAIFNISLNGSNTCIVILENRVYEVTYPIFLSAYNAIYEYSNISNKTILGNGAIIKDLRLLANSGNYNPIISFSDSNNLTIKGLTYLNENRDGFVIESHIGYRGYTFIQFYGDCDSIDVDIDCSGARFGIQHGSYAGYWKNGMKGLSNSNFTIRANMTGYPVSFYHGEKLNIYVESNTHHRAAYLGGVSDSVIKIKAKNPFIAPIQCLLTDTRYSNTEGEVHFKSFYNNKIDFEDVGTDIEPVNDQTSLIGNVFCVGFNLYSNSDESYSTRNEIYDIHDISINITSRSKYVGEFFNVRSSKSYNNANKDIYRNINVICSNVNVSEDLATGYISCRIAYQDDCSYDNVKYEIKTAGDVYVYPSTEQSQAVEIVDSRIKKIAAVGSIKISDSVIEYIGSYGSSLSMSIENINSTLGISSAARITSLRSGIIPNMAPKDQLPASCEKGALGYDETANRLMFKNSSRWVYQDGYPILHAGGTMPTVSDLGNGSYRGFWFVLASRANVFNVWDGYGFGGIPAWRLFNKFCGNLSEREHPAAHNNNSGTPFYAKDTHTPLWYDNGIWYEYDGTPLYVGTTLTKRVGETSERPTSSKGIKKGFRYFDTTLNRPLWWNGTVWVEATTVTPTLTTGTKIAEVNGTEIFAPAAPTSSKETIVIRNIGGVITKVSGPSKYSLLELHEQYGVKRYDWPDSANYHLLIDGFNNDLSKYEDFVFTHKISITYTYDNSTVYPDAKIRQLKDSAILAHNAIAARRIQTGIDSDSNPTYLNFLAIELDGSLVHEENTLIYIEIEEFTGLVS